MSEARDARPNMVAPNPYGGTGLPEIVSAKDWRPAGTEGEVMVEVPEEFQITESLRHNAYERVRFPAGTYLVPTRISVMRRIPRGENGEYAAEERWLYIGGIDETSMHWKLKDEQVKHSALQPQLAATPPPARALERFCGYCGREKSKPHARDCPRYVPAPLRPDKLSVADMLGTNPDRIHTEEGRALPRRRGGAPSAALRLKLG